MNRPTIGYAGMTHLGLNSAAAAAERGFDIVGFDPERAAVAALARGEVAIAEPGLAESLARNRERLEFSADAERLARCDVVYVAPDVPTDDQGASDLAPLRALIATVDGAMREDAILVVLSQVPPGFTRSLARPADRLYYQVETLIFGRAVERALRPERFIVGAAEPAGPLPTPLAAFLAAFACPVLVMRYESAELAKIAINCCLVASVTTANTLAELCERLGADWLEIVPALRFDRRIGPHAYLAPGLGIAGGNLERDLATVVRLSEIHGTEAGTVRAWRRNSAYRRDWALRTLHAELLSRDPEAVVAVLGLAYKPDTRSTRNSAALALLEALAPFAVAAYDPRVTPRAEWHPRLRRAASALEACRGADALAVMTPWPEFAALDPGMLASVMSGRLIVDPYRVLERAACTAAGFRHFALGVGPASALGSS